MGKRVRCEIERGIEWVFMLADCFNVQGQKVTKEETKKKQPCGCSPCGGVYICSVCTNDLDSKHERVAGHYHIHAAIEREREARESTLAPGYTTHCV